MFKQPTGLVPMVVETSYLVPDLAAGLDWVWKFETIVDKLWINSCLNFFDYLDFGLKATLIAWWKKKFKWLIPHDGKIKNKLKKSKKKNSFFYKMGHNMAQKFCRMFILKKKNFNRVQILNFGLFFLKITDFHVFATFWIEIFNMLIWKILLPSGKVSLYNFVLPIGHMGGALLSLQCVANN